MNVSNELNLSNYVLEGETLQIKTYPAVCLKQKSSPVENFDDELRILCKNMLYTMYTAPGLGLAAPQVGIPKSIFVMDIDYEREKITKTDESTDIIFSNFNPQIFINPIILKKDGEIIHEEGCLSLPGIYEEVKRFQKITLEFMDLKGGRKTIEAEDLHAVCIQHESDHLFGKVFLDRISVLKRNLIKKKILKERKKT